MALATAPPAPPPDLEGLSESELVALGVVAQLQQNSHRARLLQVMAELRDRCARDHLARRADARQPHFVLTPLEEVKLELATPLGLGDHAVESALHLHDGLTKHFPEFWEQCLAGRLDLDRAAVVLESATSLARTEDVPRLAALMAAYLAKHDDAEAPLVPLTRQQLSRAAAYRKQKFEQKPDGQRFAEAFAERRVSLRLGDNGIGNLSCSVACTDGLLADHRLTLIARKRCELDGEERTLDQMRADTLLDLVLGRLRVGALTSELEDDLTAAGEDPVVTFEDTPLAGHWARPVINVTVPVTTLLGLDEAPGLMAGDVSLPADLVRQVATDPGSTWHRLLTDPAGAPVELSSNGYRPSAPLVRKVEAVQRTCVWPGCCRASTQCELDHRLEFPAGATCEGNLDPLCKRHHRTKHSAGVTVRRLADGRYEVRTSRGTVLRSHPSELPVPEPREVAA